MHDLLTSPEVSSALLILFAVDELLPYLPIKGNNYIQVFQGIIRALKPLRREDEAVAELRQEILELHGQIQSLKRTRTRTTRPTTTRGR